MKFKTKKLLSLITATIFISSTGCAIAMEYRKSPEKSEKIDAYDIYDIKDKTTVNSLLASHSRAIEQQMNEQTIKKSPQQKSIAKDSQINSNQESTSLQINNEPAQIVTPAALLTKLLAEVPPNHTQANRTSYAPGNEYEYVYKNLNKLIKNDNQNELLQQTRTLLVRAHPELVKGLPEKLSYLPNRFMSYFKEQLPTLNSSASIEKFTQSLIVQTLKTMPDFKIDTLNETLLKIKKQYADKLAKELNALSDIHSPESDKSILQWLRNLIIDTTLAFQADTNKAQPFDQLSFAEVAQEIEDTPEYVPKNTTLSFNTGNTLSL